MDTGFSRTRVHKFSCKPPGHDAARQRENQRRHRARVKGRIAELEELLLGTQSRLDDALKRIESLTAEVQRLRHATGSRPTTSTQKTAQQRQPFLEPATCPELEAFDRGLIDVTMEETLSVPDALPTLSATTYRETSESAREQNASSTREPRISTPQPLFELLASELPVSGFDDPNDDYALLPPPSVGESTIPCREAYSIIKDRSAPEFDLSTATEWLLPGFRCAVVPGTGCRVQTHMLFAFVDHITPM
ncbi:uncharacterized protein B0H64DRAFT_80967 [Chaetomium fimeti]|uniref:BZIP domain-containing protein n=1 Tax=Chaetomium fimeti TaxID=1854472 RepID=A0AAE0LVC7_9PEZI|nr:hypothetical protein B0H64DRAFT_80967 [Chaetomium fimeti]